MPATVTSEAGVCNVALAFVGEKQFINALDEPSTPARICKVHYALARDCVLEAFEWRFCKRTAALAGSVETRDGWAHVYGTPSDCLKPRAILNSAVRLPARDQAIPFEQVLNDAGDALLICTDQEQASLVYSRHMTTVALMPAHVVDAIAWELATRIALSLPVKPDLARTLQPKAAFALARAIAQDGNVGTPDMQPESELIRVRG